MSIEILKPRFNAFCDTNIQIDALKKKGIPEDEIAFGMLYALSVIFRTQRLVEMLKEVADKELVTDNKK